MGQHRGSQELSRCQNSTKPHAHSPQSCGCTDTFFDEACTFIVVITCYVLLCRSKLTCFQVTPSLNFLYTFYLHVHISGIHNNTKTAKCSVTVFNSCIKYSSRTFFYLIYYNPDMPSLKFCHKVGGTLLSRTQVSDLSRKGQ